MTQNTTNSYNLPELMRTFVIVRTLKDFRAGTQQDVCALHNKDDDTARVVKWALKKIFPTLPVTFQPETGMIFVGEYDPRTNSEPIAFYEVSSSEITYASEENESDREP